MKDVYVVDTGQEEVYVYADSEGEAESIVMSELELDGVNYAEFYSDDPTDVIGYEILGEAA